MPEANTVCPGDLIFRAGEFCLNRGEVSTHFWLSDELIQRICALSDDESYPMANIHPIISAAQDALKDERADTNNQSRCRRGADCRATTGFSYTNARGKMRPDDPSMPEADICLSVSCPSAMIRKGDGSSTSQAPVELKKLGKRARVEIYRGVMKFDGSCYAEMGFLAIRFAELCDIEIKKLENPGD